MTDADAVAVGELPAVDLDVVDGRSVGGVEIGEHRGAAVPADLDVATRHAGVGQAELCVLAATDDVGALTQLEGAVAAVLEEQRDRGGCIATGVSVALVVPIAGLLCVTLLISLLAIALVVTLLRVALGVVVVLLAVAGLLCVALAVAGLLCVALVVAGLLGVTLLLVALLVSVAGLLALRRVVAALLAVARSLLVALSVSALLVVVALLGVLLAVFLLALAVAPGVVVSGFCASPLVVTGILRHGWDSYLLWCVWLWGRTGSRRLGLRPRGPTTCGPRWF